MSSSLAIWKSTNFPLRSISDLEAPSLPQCLFAGEARLNHTAPSRSAVHAPAIRAGKTAEYVGQLGVLRVREGVLHHSGKPPLDTFRPYDYYRLPSISFV